MTRLIRLITIFFISASFAIGLSAKSNSQVLMKTTQGDIVIELFDEQAPVTVKNFLSYVNSGFYKGTLFHRVIPNFMIQGGGFITGMSQKKTAKPIINEASNKLSNVRGTIAMARTPDPNSATSQFFINVVDNYALDYKNSSPQGFGYCVFGKVIKGMEVVDKIRFTSTQNLGPFQNVPVQDIVILSVKRIK